MNRPKTKILVDGGDPQETRKIKKIVGFVDGQTTNPSLIANNPEMRELVGAGHKLSENEELAEYRKIVQEISPLVGEAGVSIEVLADRKSTAQEMFAQGKEMYSWIPSAYIKYPCTAEGLRAAQMSVQQGLRVNLTLCFSQQQAAAVYGATKGTRETAPLSLMFSVVAHSVTSGFVLLESRTTNLLGTRFSFRPFIGVGLIPRAGLRATDSL